MNVLLISAILGVVMMFSSFLIKNTATVRTIGITGTIALLILNVLEMYGTRLFNINTAGFLSFDRFTLVFISIAIIAMLVYFLLTAKDMEKVNKVNYAEYFALLFFILCGIVLVSGFESLLILFLGIEIVSIPLYVLTGSDKRNLKSNEAALKYFLMGCFSTGLMLMGITLIYGAQGTFTVELFNFTKNIDSPLAIAGMLLLLFSMAFKASVAPLHFWTPDVYDGAPTVFTSFMATIVKAAVFFSFFRLFNDSFTALAPQWQFWMAVLAALTLFIGNITAVFQHSVKRMLAYSSIAQAGFMLLAIFAMSGIAKEGLLLYAAAYSFASIGIFSVLTKMDDYTFDGFNGLVKQQPLVAAAITIFILSLAGIPLTAGFLAKFYMIQAVIQAGGHLWLAIFALVMAAVSVYYYFRVIQAMYFKQGNANIQASNTFKYTLLAVAILVVLLGIFPNLITNWLYF